LITRETVERETPDSLAISSSVRDFGTLPLSWERSQAIPKIWPQFRA
jgi:hypothetical protein